MASAHDPLLKRPLYVYDLPREILDTLQPKEPTTLSSDTLDVPTENGSELSTKDGELPKATSCALCNLSFSNVQEQRSHVRSDLHNYNLKQKMRGLKPVQEAEFEKLVGDLDESLSGSESSGSDSETDNPDHTKNKDNDTMLSSLLKRQANVTDAPFEDVSSRKRKRGAGTPPLIWFKSNKLHQNVSLGVYRAILTNDEQSTSDIVQTIRSKQLPPAVPPKPSEPSIRDREEQGGVPLPLSLPPNHPPHIFLCMIGGGHFAGMVVSLAPKLSKHHGASERQASVLAHKTFHRYTTRRKQGGSQAANDSAKGAAHSAGSSLRRYNEVALTNEVRELLSEWRELIASAQLLFIRATGSTNRRTLFGPYDEQVLVHNDSRMRGFPFSTRRATQAELMRCFVELTRVKVSEVDEAALAAAEAKAAADAEQEASEARGKSTTPKPSAPPKDPEAEAAVLHTTQIEALIRRSKAPALLTYLSSNSLSPNYTLHPPDSPAHHHAPTPLHLAASLNSAAVVLALLSKSKADPTVQNGDGKTAFEIAGERATRDAFRQARTELGEEAWAWDSGARVAEGLSKEEVERRAERERKEQSEKEAAARQEGLREFEAEQERKGKARGEARDERSEARMTKKGGKGQSLNSVVKTAEERREEEARGMTPEMRMRLEREKRARAAEERMRAAKR